MLLAGFFGHDLDFSKSAQMFTYHHIILLSFAIFAIVGTLFIAVKVKARENEKTIKYIYIGVLIVLELAYHIHNWTAPLEMRLDRGPSVPLHVCSFALFFNIALLYTDSKRIFNYAFIFGVIGGFMAMGMPNSLGYTYLNFRYYHYILLHTIIMAVPIYYYKAYNYRIDYKTLLDIFRNVVVLGVIVFMINSLIGTNYWFIKEIPDNVDSWFPNWTIYILTFTATVFFTMNVLYVVSNYKTIFNKKV
jgi:hypothetical integral membrane protein (TIGR02206 family)